MTSFLARWLQRIRRRFYPAYHLRRVPPALWALTRVDRPWMTRIEGVPHPVAVRLGRNLGTVLSRGVAEEREERDDCLALLQRTVAHHGSDRVRLHAVALSDAEGSAPFERDIVTGATGGLTDGRAISPLERRWSSRRIEVMTSTMDVEGAKLGMPDLVKIDVEGAELEVLRGGQRTLRDHRPILLVECTRRQTEVREVLEDVGYEIRDPRSPVKSVSGPGMPFMAVAIDPRIHRVVGSASAHHDDSP